MQLHRGPSLLSDSLALLKRGVAALLLLGLGAQRVAAMPPPTAAMLKRYREDGTLPQRIAFAKEIGNHKADPQLLQDAQRRVQELARVHGVNLPASAVTPTPPSAWRGLPTKGSPKMFILMIDFSDYPADPVNTLSAVAARAFGDGDGVQAAPYESLKSYYYRSSYGQLTISGNVLGYYRPAYTRASMGTSPTTAQRQALIKEALLAQSAAGHDFSQYDNNASGKIDYFAVLWTGPDTGWSNFWWAYQTNWSNSTTPLTLNGRTLGKYVWQWVSNKDYPTRNAPAFDPKVLIHETGHALGLPDYYDYDATVGPRGGLGRLDMMDGNWGDHNCFSKFLLDWTTPAVITSSVTGQSLLSSGDHKDNSSFILMDTNPGGTFGEYFMVQNRQRVGNDTTYPADGLLIWHVDSRLDPATGNANYLYDNSYTAHKLLRLMEADGLEEIETLGSQANAGDYWIAGKQFGPGSLPNSNRYDGTFTRMGIRNISAAGPSMTLDVFQIPADTTPPTGSPSTPTATATLDTLTYTWTVGSAADADSGIVSYRLQVGTTPGGNDVFDALVGNVLTYTVKDLGWRDGTLLYGRVAALNGGGLASAYSGDCVGPAIALPTFDGSVLDNTNLLFKTLGPWTVDPTAYSAGLSSARSAVITDSSKTYLQAKLVGPGTLTFDWKVLSEAGYDFLTFSLDGVEQPGKISGTTAFATVNASIPAGTHVARWTYAKDEASAPTGDGAWVDNVQWSGSTIAAATVTPANYATITGGAVPFSATVSNGSSSNQVTWGITTGGGTFTPATTASGSATTLTGGATADSYIITATPVQTPNFPGSASLQLVSPSSVVVGLVPSATTVTMGTPVTCTSSVSLLTDKTVTWIKDGGTWTGTPGASATWSSAVPGTYHLTATSTVSPTSVATVTVIVIGLALDHTMATLLSGGSATFTCSGDLGGGVTWTLTGLATKVDSGLSTTVTVPTSAPLTTGTYTLTATDKQDASRKVTATLTVKGMDLVADGLLNPMDLLGFAAEWGKGTGSPANFKGTGTVDNTDLAALLNQIK
ncbi:M6 family metalloprotease domain-containing protein [Geothrix sp. PMB-07]|uniref:M6 family metalloprotease domain-containing protein n=1 Tax=Geothrix sp. PMB-07 TaxID=3068640 RepID=UPI0027429014|nr:M6 family metalloprotease domain-containing protein [Geothrix sp. PMB-07]WLT31424.1 M6 family metalloprotease domain-containing protein [Geothrix sp. PMB-07]